MAALPPSSPPWSGLPASPRGNRPVLSPLTTSFAAEPLEKHTNHSAHSRPTPQSLVMTEHRSRSSLIFINATIPTSPADSDATTTTFASDADHIPHQGLVPRKRSALARFFCCFGREERARRRVMRATEFEKVGESTHWTEY